MRDWEYLQGFPQVRLWKTGTFDLMQFTGLRDKNGREIYEGDLVTCGERLGVGRLLRRTKGEIHYVAGSGCFCIQIPWIEFGDTDDGSKVSWEMSHYSDIEVIGHIYKNPEPLTP